MPGITVQATSAYIITNDSASGAYWSSDTSADILGTSASVGISWNTTSNICVTGNFYYVGDGLVMQPYEADPLVAKIRREKSWIRQMAYAARERKRKQAESVATRLLEELFGHEIEPEGDYLRIGSALSPSRNYRIPLRGGMVQVWEGGKKDHALCVHPRSEFGCPGPDTAIAQRIALEADEEAFLKLANRHPLY